MKPIKLSPIKRMMMFVLSLLVHNVYHTDAFGWTVVASGNAACSATAQCRSYSSPGGYAILLMSAPSIGLDIPSASYVTDDYSSHCLCLNSLEYASLQKCTTAYCSTTLGGTQYTGVRTAKLGTSGSSSTSVTCNAGYGRCACVSGWYANGTTCTACTSGYYCSTTTTLAYLGGGIYGRTPCPDSGTSASGANSVSKCYVPTGTTGTDTKGVWKYTGNCYYGS